MSYRRPDGALRAGVCAGIAESLGWNVWALRALFLLFLLVKSLWAVVAYVALAALFYLLGTAGLRSTDSDNLESPELAGRSRRIAELERRFRDLEEHGDPR